MRVLAFCFSVAIFSAVVAPARAAVVLGYDAENLSGALPVTTEAAGVDGVNLTRGSGIAFSSQTGDYASTGFTTSLTPLVDDSLNFSFTTSTSYQLTSLELFGREDGPGANQGPRTLQLDVAINGGAFSTITPNQSVGASNGTITFNLASVGTVTTGAIFRLKGFNSTNENSRFHLAEGGNFGSTTSDLVVNGNIVAVPEASAFAFGGAICAVAGFWQWRQKRRREEALV
jgi:hypothetical protein